METVNKHAVVVGGTAGIGLSITQAFSYENIKVSVIGRSDSFIKRWNEIYKDAAFYRADLSNINDVSEVYRRIDSTTKRIDILVNCAAYLPSLSLVKDYSIEEFTSAMDVNVKAPFFLCRLVLPQMLARNSGVIINLSSAAVFRPAPKWSAYSMSKAALQMLSSTLTRELEGTNIRIYSVNPGATRTKMRRSAFPNEDASRLPHPLQMVGMYVYLVKEEPRYSNEVIDVCAWLEMRPEWREYGANLKRMIENEYGIVY